MKLTTAKELACSVTSALLAVCLISTASRAESVSFLVDPATIDVSPSDGIISGSEFSPTGTDGTIFALTPTNNLVGADRFLLSPVNGLSFGGGSGSTLSFDFTPSNSIQLESFTIGGGLSINNPVFDIREGASVLSMSNSGDASDSFVGAPLTLQGGTTYSFVVTAPGAGVQRQMASWEYTVVPESTTASICLLAVALFSCVRMRK